MNPKIEVVAVEKRYIRGEKKKKKKVFIVTHLAVGNCQDSYPDIPGCKTQQSPFLYYKYKSISNTEH